MSAQYARVRDQLGYWAKPLERKMNEVHYRFPMYAGPLEHDFLRDNNIAPIDIPAGSGFFTGEDDNGRYVAVQVFVRKDGQRVAIDPDSSGEIRWRSKWEQFDLRSDPSQYGFRPIGDGSVGAMA